MSTSCTYKCSVLALQDEQWLVKEMSPVEPKMLELDISEKHKFMQQFNRWNFFYKKRDADTFRQRSVHLYAT